MKKLILAIIMITAFITGGCEKKAEVTTKSDGVPAYFLYAFQEVDENTVNFILEAKDAGGDSVWEERWNSLVQTELDPASVPVVDGDKIFVEVEGKLHAIEKNTGTEVWSVDSIGSISCMYVEDNKIYASSYYGAFLTCIEGEKGKVLWKNETEDFFWPTSISREDDKLAVACVAPGESEPVDNIVFFDENGNIISSESGEMQKDEAAWEADEASSTLNSDSQTYGAANISDDDKISIWSEGADGYGIGEFIRIKSKVPATVNAVSISNVYKKFEEYDKFSELKSFKIELSDSSQITVKRTAEADYEVNDCINIIFAEPVNTNYIKLTIIDAFPGELENTGISEIEVK